MDAKDLYSRLDKDFDIENLKDDWSFMRFNEYFAPIFKKRYMGIMLDNTSEVKKVFTATIPDTDILKKIIQTDQTDVHTLISSSNSKVVLDQGISTIPALSSSLALPLLHNPGLKSNA